MGYVLIHALALLVFVAVLAVPGVLWDSLYLRGRVAEPLRPVAFFATAATTWMVVVFALCAVQEFRRGPVLIVLAVLSVAAAIVWRRSRVDRRPLPWPLPSEERGSPGWLIIAIPLGIVFGACFLLALMPRPATDADVYHLTLPRLFIDSGGFRRIPFSVFSNWPMNTELLFGLAMLFHDHITATLVHYFFAILLSLTFLRACRMWAPSQSTLR